jgi:hypothetical protein
MKTPTLEEVKQKYLNAKEISFLEYDYEKIDISNILGDCYISANKDIYTQFETHQKTKRRVLLYDAILDRYAEIISYKDEPIGNAEQLQTPNHYDNSKGTLYKVATERNWNPYLFDIVKRLERAEKKGEFKTDLEKSINVIKLWLNESE